MRVIGIDHVALRVRDLEEMTAFYVERLGLSLDRRRDDLGLVHLRAGDVLLDLVAADGVLGRRSALKAKSANLDHLCLSVAAFDADDVASALRAIGASAEAPMHRYGAGGDALSIYLRDPEGNGLELRGGA